MFLYDFKHAVCNVDIDIDRLIPNNSSRTGYTDQGLRTILETTKILMFGILTKA